ncbi:hypothetical protein COU74_02935 [Candidatus Peregrinibacteria bacterium CG10_big_fil_rev_8_21_14_0_10_36_19]|nr:MAG: hypothetical protein COU74_02935 [Candidatus Peregrinibacteria bacterium CG10_big_fil_rev_8_21_14_0_10_36_19]
MALDKPEGAEGEDKKPTMCVIEITDDPELTRPIIERRLRLAEELAGLPAGQGVRFEDSAYAAIAAITSGNPGLTLEVTKQVLLKVQAERSQLPCIVTGTDVESLGLTREALEANWDNPLRQAHVMHCKPWWQK